jgi:hypothetical protein
MNGGRLRILGQPAELLGRPQLLGKALGEGRIAQGEKTAAPREVGCAPRRPSSAPSRRA